MDATRAAEAAQGSGEGPVTAELPKAISEAFNSRDVERILSHFAEDAVFFMASGPETMGRTVAGKAAIRRVLADRLKLVPDIHWAIEHEYAFGIRAVSVWRVTGHGTDGLTLEYQGCDLDEFRGDKVCRKDTYWKIVRPDLEGRSALLP
ncbi:MAG TPA: nuclear transport factor 2 family protein [Acetobacteraceae bacterium]|nr:nuclear transport factor 2 family protein [Acetobacteraceae bacterium]